jgi:hypothetical protein
MKFTILLLALVVIMAGASASPVKYSPSLNFYQAGHSYNMTVPVNLTDAARQDTVNAANASAVQRSGSTWTGNMTSGGYLLTGQVGPNKAYKVFLFTVPWIGAQRAIALREDYGDIRVSTSNSTAIQYALDNGIQTTLYSNFTISSTVWMNKTETLQGIGPGSGLYGSVSPLLKTDLAQLHNFVIQNMDVTTTSTNTGIYVLKNDTIGTIRLNKNINHINFYAKGDAGYLLEMQGVTSTVVEECNFHGNTMVAKTDCGIYLTASGATQQTMNNEIKACYFGWLGYGISSVGDSSYIIYNAGLNIQSCFIVGCRYGLYCSSTDTVYFQNGMIDSCDHGIVFVDVCTPLISNNHILVATPDLTCQAAIYITSVNSDVADDGIIYGNKIYQLNTTAGKYTVFVAGASAKVIDGYIIDNNHIYNAGSDIDVVVYQYTLSCTVSNNYIYNTNKNCIYTATPTDYIYIRNNWMKTSGTAIADTAVHSIKSGNYNNNVAV